ncbi:hypothetical protein [Hippea maritima]|uniref:NHL repeat containing protein n=1 Tax=Hippea maritima (strain ATCC 700847 / DSM 10411 / MH2) TaxID=760142 RepID=F2LVE7_HIPMA|nr:hypothetical protein [Hippea maritima]AEA33731.1 hypothetical protein Hipma_0761 [Hippea maritima DSM 10411]
MSFLNDKKLFFFVLVLGFVMLAGFKLVNDSEVIGLKHPESVCFYKNYLYVSNIGSSPTSPNKDGFITKLDRYGNILEYEFIDDLKAPKGIFAYNDKLYIADLTRLCIYDFKAKGLVCYPVEGAKFLNDVYVVDGEAYITDTVKNCIFRIDRNGKSSVFFSWDYDFEPNGIVFLKENKAFIVVSFVKPLLDEISFDGRFIKSFKLRGLTGFDGISIDNGGVFISDYKTGKVIKTDISFKHYQIVKDFHTPAADIITVGNRIFAPLLEDNKLYIGRIK